MTVQNDVQRAGLRAMTAETMVGVPEYSADPNVLSRVGDVIGATASHEERHVRASDSLPRSTSKATSPEQAHSASKHLALVGLHGHVVLYGRLTRSAGLLVFRVGFAVLFDRDGYLLRARNCLQLRRREFSFAVLCHSREQ